MLLSLLISNNVCQVLACAHEYHISVVCMTKKHCMVGEQFVTSFTNVVKLAYGVLHETY